jgi:uncharacterized membrane protein
MIKEIFFIIDVIGLGILLGGGVYESVVINPNYRINIPQSLNHLRNFMKATTPANLFRVASPVTMVSLILTVIFYWGLSSTWWFIAALISLVVADIITYTFHYPRNKVLFIDPLSPDTEMLNRLAKEWGQGNIVRILLITISIIVVLCGIFSLAKLPGA